MDLGNIFGAPGTTYKPSGLFSFEFFNKDDHGNLAGQITEVFLIVPPEQYSLKEGYRISINKTIGGGWVDDFGNDFKELTLSGSLNSYYFGIVPDSDINTNVNYGLLQSTANNFKQTNSNIRDSINKITKTQISGLDEFFKLRYILSRYRDKSSEEDYGRVKEAFPELLNLISTIGSGRALSDSVGIVWHDYDDNNHLVIVPTSFSSSRAANDVFTITWSLTATALRNWKGKQYNVGAIQSKEDPIAFIKEMVLNLTDMKNVFVNVPSSLGQEVNNFLAQITDIINNSTTLISDTSYVKTFQNQVMSAIENCESMKNSAIVYGLSPLHYAASVTTMLSNYNSEIWTILDDDINNYINTIDHIQDTLQSLLGIDKYYKNNPEIAYLDTNTSIQSDNTDVQSIVMNDKLYYEVKQGDTMAGIALIFYKNPDKASYISQANNLKNSDFYNDGMVGKNIVIPLTRVRNNNFLANNLVYFNQDLRVLTPEERQIQVLGFDFKVGEQREFIVDGTGDFACDFGLDCYVQNIMDRIRYVRGTLIPLHPDWGMLIGIGDVPTNIALQKLADDVAKQIQADPRTEYAFVNQKQVSIYGDTVYIPLVYKPITGSENIVNIGDYINLNSY